MSKDDIGEPLAKRSKNVREQTRNIDPETAHQRILSYIRAKGIRAQAASKNTKPLPGSSVSAAFGHDDKGSFVRYSPGDEISPEHDLGHMLMTPKGQSVNTHQAGINNMKGPAAEEDDLTASQIGDAIARRAGVAPRSGISEVREMHGRYGRDAELADMVDVADKVRPAANKIVSQLDAGTQKLNTKTGTMDAGTSVDAKINARAMRKTMDDKKIQAQWMGKPILQDDHAQDLETRAAINEFGEAKMPRHAAEQKAHEDYVKDHRERAAAHHLAGMRAANAVGDKESARKHWLMYDLHTKALGKDSIGAVPQEIEAKLAENGKMYRFKAHKGDMYALQGRNAEPKTSAEPMAKSDVSGSGSVSGGPVPMNLSEKSAGSKQCKWKLGERRCRRKVNNGYCHDHEGHWANKIKQKEAVGPESLEKNQLPGGKADKAKPEDFDQEQLREGIKHEMEHTKDASLAAEIAMDHLAEDPKYYTKLRSLEKNLPTVAPKIAPVSVAAPKPAAPAPAPAAPGLHNSVEGFMGALKAMPKGGAERGKFITAHMNHGPFLSALKAHPQGAQMHQQLTQFMNSAQNAGFKAGAAKVMAKSEAEEILSGIAELAKGLLSKHGK